MVMGASDIDIDMQVLLEVVSAKNLKVNGQGKGKGKGSVFVRIISSEGCVPVNTREVEASSKPQWAEPLWLRCSGRGRGRAKACNLLDELRSQFVVFELRLRSTRPFSSWISTGRRSELLGRVRIPWQDVLDSPKLSIENWFPLMLAKRSEDCSSNPPPSLHIVISAQCGYVDELMLQKNARHRQLLERDDCACKGRVCSGSHDYNIL